MAARRAVTVDERLLTVAEVAQTLRVTAWTVCQWLKAGKLRGTRLGSRRAGWRIRECDFQQFVARGLNEPDEPAAEEPRSRSAHLE
jgi:excisionase family DNA binding protein